jgi:RimJ/RimL family protein N-acetyltransferase
MAFHEGLSFQTVYRRFFGVHPHLTLTEAEHFCSADTADRLAFVAVADGEIIGVARLERLAEPSTAEVAFVITDRYQHLGLGHDLVQVLVGAALRRGITELVADVLPDNEPMLKLLPAAGFAVSTSYSGGVVTLTCRIRPAPPGSSKPGGDPSR